MFGGVGGGGRGGAVCMYVCGRRGDDCGDEGERIK